MTFAFPVRRDTVRYTRRGKHQARQDERYLRHAVARTYRCVRVCKRSVSMRTTRVGGFPRVRTRSTASWCGKRRPTKITFSAVTRDETFHTYMDNRSTYDERVPAKRDADIVTQV